MSVGSVPKLGIFNWPQELFVVHKAILILSGQALDPSPLLPGHPSPQSQRQALTQKRERKKNVVSPSIRVSKKKQLIHLLLTERRQSLGRSESQDRGAGGHCWDVTASFIRMERNSTAGM